MTTGINKIFSITWQTGVASGVAWNSFFNINNPKREMYLKSIFYNINYYNVTTRELLTEDQVTTQWCILSIVPIGVPVGLFQFTGGVPGIVPGTLTFNKSVNVKYEAFLFQETIPFAINGFNNGPDAFEHWITLSVEIQEV